MFPIVSGISFLLRCYLCYITIDNIPILANPIANSILLEVVSLYAILRVICYFTVGRVYKSGDAPILGAIMYLIVYIVFLGIMFGIMWLLTYFGVLPITI